MPARIVSCVRSRVCAAGRPARVPRDGGGEAGAQGSLDGCSAAAGAVGTRRRPICDYRARMQRKICAAITVEPRRHARVMRDGGGPSPREECDGHPYPLATVARIRERRPWAAAHVVRRAGAAEDPRRDRVCAWRSSNACWLRSVR
jgi:hypothetical protein